MKCIELIYIFAEKDIMTIDKKKLKQIKDTLNKQGSGSKSRLAEAIGVNYSAITLMCKHGEIAIDHYNAACKCLGIKA